MGGDYSSGKDIDSKLDLALTCQKSRSLAVTFGTQIYPFHAFGLISTVTFLGRDIFKMWYKSLEEKKAAEEHVRYE